MASAIQSSRVVCLILGGGRGTRLYPLTKLRSKPAVPIAGKYRLIDIPISNCLHSNLNQIYVLTQFNSASLHRHIANTYKFDAFSRAFVEILAAQQTMEEETWYQGTADAVRRNMQTFNDPSIELVLILSGDQLYRMDFRDMIRSHRESNAAATIAALPVDEATATGCGIMKIDDTGRVTSFVEKPKTPEALALARTDPDWMEKRGIQARGRAFLASMGIYMFNRQVIVDLLGRGAACDFGKEVFPQALSMHRVQTHLFDGYWEDIGTIDAFHKANIDLTLDDPTFDFIGGDRHIYSRARFLPCSRVSGARIDHSLIADSCVIGKGSIIENSVIGIRSQIGENVTIRNSYVMGMDFYERDAEATRRAGEPLLGIGSNTLIENAIVDKNPRIGSNVRIQNREHIHDAEETPYCVIRDGIVVIPKTTTIPSGTVI